MRPALSTAPFAELYNSWTPTALFGVDFYPGHPYYDISLPGNHALTTAKVPHPEKVGAGSGNSRYDGRPSRQRLIFL
jgi:hypothetical protein